MTRRVRRQHSDVGKFIVPPKRWVVERATAWLGRCRRLAKDRECLPLKLSLLGPPQLATSVRSNSFTIEINRDDGSEETQHGFLTHRCRSFYPRPCPRCS